MFFPFHFVTVLFSEQSRWVQGREIDLRRKRKYQRGVESQSEESRGEAAAAQNCKLLAPLAVAIQAPLSHPLLIGRLKYSGN